MQAMTWMFTGDEAEDSKLREAYESVIHITAVPYFLGEDYRRFREEVQVKLRQPPFNSDIDLSRVGLTCFLHMR